MKETNAFVFIYIYTPDIYEYISIYYIHTDICTHICNKDNVINDTRERLASLKNDATCDYIKFTTPTTYLFSVAEQRWV